MDTFFSGAFITFLAAMTPVIELRGAIPLGVFKYGLSINEAFLFSVVGNMIPAFFIYFFLDNFSCKILDSKGFCSNILEKVFKRTRLKFNKTHLRYGSIGLMIFVAIPLPMTGVWTATVAAWLFGIKKNIALPYILAGVIIAGFIVSLLTLGLL